MSWFKELTSKAEAVLVKLDQDAAQALQKPEILLSGTKLSDYEIDAISDPAEDTPETEQLINENDNQTTDNNYNQDPTSRVHDRFNETEETDIMRQSHDSSQIPKSIQYKDSPQLGGATSIQNDLDIEISTNHSGEPDNQVEFMNNTIPPNESQQSNKHLPKKFTIKTSKTKPNIFMLEKHSNRKVNSATVKKERPQTNGYNQKPDTTLASPVADDIRASINRSLQEYAIQTFSTSNNVPRDKSSLFQQTPYQSHFDSQPNMIQHSPLLETGYDENLSTSRLHSPLSFSIDVPEDAADSRLSNNIALRLLQQSASKKKSTFYLQKLINRLANPSRQSSIFGGQMRINFRRSQLRVASYTRRLNYYFRAYPMMKYLMIGYLVIMQLLVIYVLFFYHSSGSSTELSSQIKQQQQELTE